MHKQTVHLDHEKDQYVDRLCWGYEQCYVQRGMTKVGQFLGLYPWKWGF